MQENNTTHKIIAINPGWRYLAIAVFDESELREWRLKSIKGRGAKRKLERVKEILAGYIERYHPDILAIKKLHPSRSSANLDIMAAGIEADCREKGMGVYSYSIQEMESILSHSTRINKKELTKLLTSEYPELVHDLKREERSRNQYFVRMFEAVALGHVCLREINNKH